MAEFARKTCAGLPSANVEDCVKTTAILQARMGSERLPGKVLAPLCGAPMLARTIDRLRLARAVDEVVVATTDLAEDDPIDDYCTHHLGCFVFRGSADDVLARYHLCAEDRGSDIVVRVTGDNPAVDPAVVDEALRVFFDSDHLDFLRFREGLPLGVGVSVFTARALARAHREANDAECREHVTPYIKQNGHIFAVKQAECIGRDYSGIRLTVDTIEDLQTMRALYSALMEDPAFSWQDAVSYLEGHPEAVMNSGVSQRQIAYRGGSDFS